MDKLASKSGIMLPQSDLLSRVGAFLPQIQKANQELEERSEDASVRVDLELKSDNEDEEENENDNDGDNDDCDDKSSDDNEEFLIKESNVKISTTRNDSRADDKGDANTNCDDDDKGGDSEKSDESQDRKQAPTIELKLTLGSLDKSPAMALLQSNSSENENENENDDIFESEDLDDDDSSNGRAKISDLLQTGKRKRDSGKVKGPLITEMS